MMFYYSTKQFTYIILARFSSNPPYATFLSHSAAQA